MQIALWRRPSLPCICKVDVWLHLWPWLNMLRLRLCRMKGRDDSRSSQGAQLQMGRWQQIKGVLLSAAVLCDLSFGYMDEDGDMDKACSVTTSVRKTLDGKSFLLLELNIHMLNVIWTLATEIQSLNHFHHSVGRTGNTFFFQLFFLMGPINSFGEV